MPMSFEQDCKHENKFGNLFLKENSRKLLSVKKTETEKTFCMIQFAINGQHLGHWEHCPTLSITRNVQNKMKKGKSIKLVNDFLKMVDCVAIS